MNEGEVKYKEKEKEGGGKGKREGREKRRERIGKKKDENSKKQLLSCLVCLRIPVVCTVIAVKYFDVCIP